MSDRQRPIHTQMSQFAVVDNCLQVNGTALSEVASALGSTPFYVYDSSVIRSQVATLKQALPQQIHLHYAMKANPMPEVVQLLESITDGLDVASHGELAVALGTGIAPEKVSFAGPGKSPQDLAAAIAGGVIINLESEIEMRRVAAEGEKQGKRPLVSIRVNPAFELKTSGMKMGGGSKPFGVDEERVPAMIAELEALDLDFRGLHIFSGSQNLRPEAIIEAQQLTFQLARTLQESASSAFRWLNIGGGLGIPYFPGEQRLDLGPIGENLTDLLQTHYADFADAEIVMELGRYLVAEAGLYVCEIVDIKESRGELYLVTNGGLHHHLSASGNFGQVIRKNYPACLGNRVNGEQQQVATVVGPLCTPLDILADKMHFPEAEVGDLVVIFQSGAYGFSASPHGFLSHPVPKQVLV